MRKLLIFGNSGAGKSTLAKAIAKSENLAHLDLDTLAWLSSTPPQRSPLKDAQRKIQDFIQSYDAWVIEGCYTDLLELASPDANEIIFLNLSVAQCIENAKNRPWEPHKYESKAAQDSNLEMLVEWIQQYPIRMDVFSLAAHQRFYDVFSGEKSMYTHNDS